MGRELGRWQQCPGGVGHTGMGMKGQNTASYEATSGSPRCCLGIGTPLETKVLLWDEVPIALGIAMMWGSPQRLRCCCGTGMPSEVVGLLFDDFALLVGVLPCMGTHSEVGVLL